MLNNRLCHDDEFGVLVSGLLPLGRAEDVHHQHLHRLAEAFQTSQCGDALVLHPRPWQNGFFLLGHEKRLQLQKTVRQRHERLHSMCLLLLEKLLLKLLPRIVEGLHCRTRQRSSLLGQQVPQVGVQGLVSVDQHVPRSQQGGVEAEHLACERLCRFQPQRLEEQGRGKEWREGGLVCRDDGGCRECGLCEDFALCESGGICPEVLGEPVHCR
mmetsp:Transcript_7044/g.17142  ORF Transcript_7044/g.17142 Transcript_7044/m.17142 type:complete len:213 (-) Transcript_7044:99-737(-)